MLGFTGARGSAGLGLGHRFVNTGMKGPQQGEYGSVSEVFGRPFGFK